MLLGCDLIVISLVTFVFLFFFYRSAQRPWARPLFRSRRPLAAILDFLGSHKRSNRIKNLSNESWSEGPITLGLTYFQTLSAILDLAGGAVFQAFHAILFFVLHLAYFTLLKNLGLLLATLPLLSDYVRHFVSFLWFSLVFQKFIMGISNSLNPKKSYPVFSL